MIIYFGITNNMLEKHSMTEKSNCNLLWYLNDDTICGYCIAESFGAVMENLSDCGIKGGIKPDYICEAEIDDSCIRRALSTVLAGDGYRNIPVKIMNIIQIVYDPFSK